MTFKKVIGKIHLWLGLVAGLVVLFLGITGCILAFEVELRNLTESYRNVESQNKSYLPPSAIKEIAEQQFTSSASGIEYPGKSKAAVVSFLDSDTAIFIEPYSGKVLYHKDMIKDFFRFVLDGHNYLWLPSDIGQPIVASATLIFILMMITGLILWWPRNKAATKQRFRIKWNARWRRKNYDLHNVLGFYMTWVSIFISLTGLVWGFEWFGDSVYWVSNGGQKAAEQEDPISDTTTAALYPNMTDQLFHHRIATIKPNESLTVFFAEEKTDLVEMVVNHRPGTFYNSDFYHYDQYSGKELKLTGTYTGQFSKARLADKIVRMNYDIHTGAVLGLPGKILAFFASLIAASLPVTGFLIWWGRKRKTFP